MKEREGRKKEIEKEEIGGMRKKSRGGKKYNLDSSNGTSQKEGIKGKNEFPPSRLQLDKEGERERN